MLSSHPSKSARSTRAELQRLVDSMSSTQQTKNLAVQSGAISSRDPFLQRLEKSEHWAVKTLKDLQDHEKDIFWNLRHTSRIRKRVKHENLDLDTVNMVLNLAVASHSLREAEERFEDLRERRHQESQVRFYTEFVRDSS